MGFDVSDDGASFNFKKGGRSFNQQQVEIHSHTPPPAPKLPTTEKKVSGISHGMPQGNSPGMQNERPPLPPSAGCQKSRSNSIYRIIAKKDGSPQQPNQQTSSERPPEQRQAPVTERRVQFEDSFESTDDTDTSDNVPSSREDTTDALSRDESQDSFEDTEMDESEPDRPHQRMMSNMPQHILEDDGDDVSLSAFVPASVRRESIIPTRPNVEQNHASDTSFDSFDGPPQPRPDRYGVRNPPQYGARESSSSLTSTESEGHYRVRDQRKVETHNQTGNRNDINDLLDEALDDEMGDDDDYSSTDVPVPAPVSEI